jgi:hypothetical protein
MDRGRRVFHLARRLYARACNRRERTASGAPPLVALSLSIVAITHLGLALWYVCRFGRLAPAEVRNQGLTPLAIDVRPVGPASGRISFIDRG